MVVVVVVVEGGGGGGGPDEVGCFATEGPVIAGALAGGGDGEENWNGLLPTTPRLSIWPNWNSRGGGALVAGVLETWLGCPTEERGAMTWRGANTKEA